MFNCIMLIATGEPPACGPDLVFPFQEDIHADLHDHVNLMMTKPIIYANMSTQPITVTRAQTGWIFRSNKSVSTYKCSLCL